MLTLPLLLAVASAGAVGGVHCAGMCGGVARLLGTPRERPTIWLKTVPSVAGSAAVPVEPLATSNWQHSVYLHAGRLSLYALVGAVVGALGAGGIWLLPLASAQHLWFIFGNLALIVMGLRLLHIPLPLSGLVTARLASYSPLTKLRLHSQQALAAGRRHPFLLGMAWGCLPCGLLFAVLPFALLSSSAWAGGLLMLVFGLTSLPHLLFVQTASQWGRRWHWVFALVLLSLGLFGLWHWDMQQMPGALCVTAP
ncbi:MAG: sulfite exporter TauE/SafE family protein [Burkholderiales bacterium]|nr:sulfite exporter TauE/SafE family protein [Burkholderiales bacterium]